MTSAAGKLNKFWSHTMRTVVHGYDMNYYKTSSRFTS